VAESMVQINKSRLGGLRRIELYGNPGTFQGRSKGGRKTINLFRQNPSLARTVGFVIRKDIKYPQRSAQLAELIGIILGDGGLPGSHQLTITFNNKTDYEYAEYICDILKRLFSVDYYIRKRKDSNGADIVVSSSNLIDFLLKQGLVKGNKVKNQVDIPLWIHEKLEYQIACLRGLMDTDGGLYLHTYNSNGRIYKYLKLCLTNRSRPLLHFVLNVLKKLNCKAYLNGNHVSIYSTSGVKKYFTEIKTHNPKHIKKFKDYFNN